MPYLIPPVISPGTLAAGEQPTLPAGGGATLRPWRPDDAPAVLAAYQDAAVQRWNLRRCDSMAEAHAWITGWRQSWADETAVHWAVADTGSDAVLGRVSLQRLVLMGGQAEISYWTLPAARGAGVCSRAVAAATAWALEQAGFHRIELGHSTANEPSCRVAARAGYPLEGIRRRGLLHADGPHDMHLHARVR